jgi:hypothetical protein
MFIFCTGLENIILQYSNLHFPTEMLAQHLKLCVSKIEITILLLWRETHLIIFFRKIVTENCPHRYVWDYISILENTFLSKNLFSLSVFQDSSKYLV